MKIRLAEPKDLEAVENIYREARCFMKNTGNETQWAGGYPQKELILSDIEYGRLYVVEEDSELLCVFVYFFGKDGTYDKIYDGKWKNSEPYGVIHRIAVSENARGKGVSRMCFDFAFGKCGNLKIDTHRDNIPMQKALARCGFEYCGVIYIDNGDERIAFQKVK